MSAAACAARTAATSRASSLADARPGFVAVAVQAVARLLSSTWVAPSTAIRWPLTLATYGAKAASASLPAPTSGRPAASAAARVSASPTGP